MSKTKVLYIVPSWNRAGAESVVKNLAENFPKDNFEIQIFCLTDEITAPYPQCMCGFHVGFGLPFRVRRKKFNISVSKLFKTISVIKKINPDITHYHLVEGVGMIIIPIIKVICKSGSVVSIHTRKKYYVNNGFKDELIKNIERWMCGLSHSEIIAASEMEYNFFKNIFNQRRLHQIDNGIDTGYFSESKVSKYSKKDLGFSADDFLISMVGRLHEVKNQKLPIRALSIMVSEFPNVKLILLGKRGGEEDNYKKLVKELQLEDNVIFFGEVDDVRPVLKISDLGLFVSRKENLSIGLLEMMSMGLPVILSDIPEFRNLFREPGKIPFVDPDNPQELSKEIIKMYHDRKRMSELGHYLRCYVEKEFSIEKQVEKHIQLYKYLVRE